MTTQISSASLMFLTAAANDSIINKDEVDEIIRTILQPNLKGDQYSLGDSAALALLKDEKYRKTFGRNAYFPRLELDTLTFSSDAQQAINSHFTKHPEFSALVQIEIQRRNIELEAEKIRLEEYNESERRK